MLQMMMMTTTATTFFCGVGIFGRIAIKNGMINSQKTGTCRGSISSSYSVLPVCITTHSHSHSSTALRTQPVKLHLGNTQSTSDCSGWLWQESGESHMEKEARDSTGSRFVPALKMVSFPSLSFFFNTQYHAWIYIRYA